MEIPSAWHVERWFLFGSVETTISPPRESNPGVLELPEPTTGEGATHVSRIDCIDRVNNGFCSHKPNMQVEGIQCYWIPKPAETTTAQPNPVRPRALDLAKFSPRLDFNRAGSILGAFKSAFL